MAYAKLPVIEGFSVGGYVVDKHEVAGYDVGYYDYTTYTTKVTLPTTYVKHVFKSQSGELTETVIVDADIMEMTKEGGVVKISYEALKMLLERCGLEEVA